MQTHNSSLNRRHFVQSLALAGTASALGLPSTMQGQTSSSERKTKLGLDNFAVRDMKWKAPQLIDYAASLKTDSLFITDFGPFESLDDKYLKEIRAKAEDKGLQIQLGSWSICPTSKTFKKDWGTAEEHLTLGLRVAKALGSPVFRVVLGNGDDRRSDGGIEARIEDTVKVCKACRSRALDAGVKIAVENHAGDMQAWELVTLIEAAGKDYVGANMDSGNATWTMEDPLASLEILAPYVVTTSLRDSAVWESENGATVQWTAMGDGTIDLNAYFAKFAALCPGVSVHIETISGFNREIPYLKEDFWKVWPKARAKDFARFLALVKKGKPREPRRGSNPQEFQKAEIEKSIKYCKESLRLGLKA
ncbi:MAG: sugar phosphate isomerase/epimerase [Verrucomicrobia bacterium]|nr:sugar phosphate isomerase/epimerase [Verrucomicrobiota bacterium]